MGYQSHLDYQSRRKRDSHQSIKVSMVQKENFDRQYVSKEDLEYQCRRKGDLQQSQYSSKEQMVHTGSQEFIHGSGKDCYLDSKRS